MVVIKPQVNVSRFNKIIFFNLLPSDVQNNVMALDQKNMLDTRELILPWVVENFRKRADLPWIVVKHLLSGLSMVYIPIYDQNP